MTAVGQGTAISNLPDTAIAQGLKARQVWGLAPRPPQAYVVPADVKTAADLKGRRLSAAGGVGGFNWLLGREVLRSAGLKVEDAQFISQGTAGRLPGFVAGQIEGVALHPEDVYLVQKQKPGAHVLTMVTDLMPLFAFNHYGAADTMIAKDHDLVRDTIAAMIEANRAIYRDRDKVVPIIMEATQKPKDAVEYAIEVLTKNCILSVNEGFVRERTEWTHQNNINDGDIPPEKKPPSTRSSTSSLRRKLSTPPAATPRSTIARTSSDERDTAASLARLGRTAHAARPQPAFQHDVRHAVLS